MNTWVTLSLYFGGRALSLPVKDIAAVEQNARSTSVHTVHGATHYVAESLEEVLKRIREAS